MKKGFSLLEVLLALGLFCLVLYGLYPIFFSIGRQVDRARREDQIVVEAKMIYEKRRAGLPVKATYQVQGRAYQLREEVVEEDANFQRIQWTLKGADYEKTWTGLIPKKRFYTS